MHAHASERVSVFRMLVSLKPEKLVEPPFLQTGTRLWFLLSAPHPAPHVFTITCIYAPICTKFAPKYSCKLIDKHVDGWR